ncbi:MAG: hypothetical protein ACE147_10335 [Candidatus Methylomirabilales bacterium]
MNKWMLGGFAYLVGIPVVALLLAAPVPQAVELPLPTVAQADASWDQKAEQALGLKHGEAQFMTEGEWQEHQRALWTLQPENREKYRAEVREQVLERAKSRSASLSVRG